VKKFKIYAWKAVVLHPFEGITFNRVHDRKVKRLTIAGAERHLLSEEAYVRYAKSNNFKLIAKYEHCLEFSLDSESSST